MFHGICRAWRGPAIAFAILLGASLFPLSDAAYAVTSLAQARGAEFVADELLVKFRSDVAQSQASGLLQSQGALELRRFNAPRHNPTAAIGRWWHAKIARGHDRVRVMAQLRRDPAVEAVELNYIVRALATPNDPRYSELWGLHNTGQTGGTPDNDIDAAEAWDIQSGDQATLVAVIDSGVDYTHPDLAANIWTNPGEIPANGIDDDGNGYIDDVHGYDFVNNDGDPMDDNRHGTHCAGTIAAVGNNGIGVVGVSWRARVMGVKFLNASGSGSTAGAVQAVLYAANLGARVMSNSWGGGGFSQALMDAISTANQAGALFVAAAGNANSNNDLTPHYPSSYNVSNVLAVAATDHSDARAGFSSYGATSVDLGAPGVNILSTVPTAITASGYAVLSGTSMATPHVSGAAALLIAQFPGITNTQLKDRLMLSGDLVSGLQGITVSGSRLNVSAAMESDSTAPSAVSDLVVTTTGTFSMTVGWSATGDDGTSGTAKLYELRYSTSPITAANFAAATLAGMLPVSGGAGTPESRTVTGLEWGTQYYFALRVRDNVGNSSALSNVVNGTTQAAQTLLSDNLEAGTGNWTAAGATGTGCPVGTSGSSLWHLSGHRVASAVNAFYYGVEATLTYNTPGLRNCGSITSVPISLAGATDSSLSFMYFLQNEGGSTFDQALVQVSNNNGTSWTTLAQLASTSLMTKHTISLAAFDGQSIRIRFFFDTVDSGFNNFEGWVVDDIAIQAATGLAPPVANAGPDQIVNGGASVNLSGIGSSGSIASFAWTQTGGSAVTLTGANTATPSFTAPNAGTFTFQLTVTGTGGGTSTDSVAIAVNSPPLADAGSDQMAGYGTTVNLSAAGSSDPDGVIAGYVWVQTGGTTVLLTGETTATPSFVAPGSAGTLSFQLTVTDNNGATAADTVIVTVNAVPTANAGPDQTVNASATVGLNAVASSDADGWIASYAWAQIGGPGVALVGPSGAAASFTAPNAAGTLTFQLTVTDNNGATASDSIVVTVVATDSGGGGGGGCVLARNAEVDPLLPTLLMLASVVMWRRRQKR